MVRHNNMISNGHFHKDWQKRTRVIFNQPAQKVARRLKRLKRAKKLSPRPVDRLRPVVRCPTVRYHTKARVGRGFTVRELSAAGLNRCFAKSVGIAVEHRRRNKSVETLQRNVQRLKEYMSKLVLFPARGKQKTVEAPLKAVSKGVNNFEAPVVRLRARVPTKDERNFNAYVALRKARAANKKRKQVKRIDNLEQIDICKK